MSVVSRKASHAGSWYTRNASDLNNQLENWLQDASYTHGPARAVISPHAGYSYCGPCAAYAYRQINPSTVKKVFILGPSHFLRLSGCALSKASIYKTPLYDLQIDQQIYKELKGTEHFVEMSLDADEEEHSIEMQLPYIAKIMENNKNSFTVVPVLVGNLSPEKEALYGAIFAPYLADPHNLFVISSDFCHWGPNFSYFHYDKSCGPIHNSIKKLDEMGMEIIEQLDPHGFNDYLKKYGNTICGQHPISVCLQAIQKLLATHNPHMQIKFLKYAQSSQCNDMRDSSVSYASASLVVYN